MNYLLLDACFILSMASVVPFLGMRFVDGDIEGIRAAIGRSLSTGDFAYAVTPNVDHVVSYHDGGDRGLREAYDGARLQICDSRILSVLARPSGRRLIPTPGSDLTFDLLQRAISPNIRMAVIGPSEVAFRRLQARFPDRQLVHLPCADLLVRDTPAWRSAVQEAAKAEWDILFICLSFPKQEMFAHDLALTGRQGGFALCVGASIDFLTGKQKRAPRAMQKAGLEWLHRLASDPGRMWRRYLVRGPVIFRLTARQYADDARRAMRGSRS